MPRTSSRCLSHTGGGCGQRVVALIGACKNYDALWCCLARCRDVCSNCNIIVFITAPKPMHTHPHQQHRTHRHRKSSVAVYPTWQNACIRPAPMGGSVANHATLTNASSAGSTEIEAGAVRTRTCGSENFEARTNTRLDPSSISEHQDESRRVRHVEINAQCPTSTYAASNAEVHDIAEPHGHVDLVHNGRSSTRRTSVADGEEVGPDQVSCPLGRRGDHLRGPSYYG